MFGANQRAGDAALLGAAGVCLSAIALAAAFGPALRATRIDAKSSLQAQ